MGGQNNLSYDASCVQPVTTTTTLAPTTTTTTPFVNPIQNDCWKNGKFWSRDIYTAGASSYSAIHNGQEEFFPKFDFNYFLSSGGVRRHWQFSRGDKFLYQGTCYTVECSYTSIPRRGGIDLTRILSDGTHVFDPVPSRYIEGPCVDPDPDNITTTTTTTLAPTTTTTTLAPTTTTTTQDPFIFPEACNYAKWSSKGECLSEKSSHINIHWQYIDVNNTIKRYMIRGKLSGCTELSQSQQGFNQGDIILINFYNANNTKIGLDYYYKTTLGQSVYQGEMEVGYNNLGLHNNLYYLRDVDLLGNKPFDDLGYSGLNQYERVDLRNITLIARHANSGGNNGCSIALPSSLTTSLSGYFTGNPQYTRYTSTFNNVNDFVFLGFTWNSSNYTASGCINVGDSYTISATDGTTSFSGTWEVVFGDSQMAQGKALTQGVGEQWACPNQANPSTGHYDALNQSYSGYQNNQHWFISRVDSNGVDHSAAMEVLSKTLANDVTNPNYSGNQPTVTFGTPPSP